jgi:hypothetical protein
MRERERKRKRERERKGEVEVERDGERKGGERQMEREKERDQGPGTIARCNQNYDGERCSGKIGERSGWSSVCVREIEIEKQVGGIWRKIGVE